MRVYLQMTQLNCLNINLYIQRISFMSKNQGQNKLPKNFADLLLNCQIQVELNDLVPKQIIMQLLQLYSKGMEYFQSIRSYKYMYFQRRMNSLMRSPKIIQSMSKSAAENTEAGKSTNADTKNTIDLNQDDKLKIMQVKHKYEKMYNDYIGQTSNLTGEKIKKIVADNQVKLNEVKQSIKDQICQQQRRLQIKLQRRKFQKETRSNSKKSMSAADLEKSTRDSLFNDGELLIREQLDIDFTKVINQHEIDSDQQKAQRKNDKCIYSADKIKKQTPVSLAQQLQPQKYSNSEQKSTQKQEKNQ